MNLSEFIAAFSPNGDSVLKFVSLRAARKWKNWKDDTSYCLAMNTRWFPDVEIMFFEGSIEDCISEALQYAIDDERMTQEKIALKYQPEEYEPSL